MKLSQIISKNLKLLFRSKETAFMIIFGPLLIMLLVSAAYTGGSNNISIGTYAPQYNQNVNNIIQSFKAKDYKLSTYNVEEECVNAIKQGVIHTCVIFPENFNLDAKDSKEIVFKVDNSRINFVYMLIDGLSSELNLQSSAISQDLTSKIITALSNSKRIVNEQYENALFLDKARETSTLNVNNAKQEINSVNLEVNFNDLQTLKGHVLGLEQTTTNFRDIAHDIVDAGVDAIRDIEDAVDTSDNDTQDLIDNSLRSLNNFTDVVDDEYLDVPDKIEAMKYAIDDAAHAVNKVKDKLEEMKTINNNVNSQLNISQQNLDGMKTNLTNMIGQLQFLKEQYANIKDFGVSGVSNPITTRIDTISDDNNKLSFTFPYLVILIIMFLGLMISSSLTVMDKTSKAAFRLFTTATKDEYYVAMSFLTTFLILILQSIIVLIIGSFFLQAKLFNNFGVSVIILLISMALFSFIGMIIGYLTRTQESSMITSLAVGIVLLFISNLVIPLETMNKVVQGLTAYNPYVVLSELLKQSMLFSSSLSEVSAKLGFLAMGMIILIIVTFIVQKSFKSKFFKGKSGDLKAEAFAAATKEVKPLLLGEGDSKKFINDVFELVDALDAMTRSEFKEIVKDARKTNPIMIWVFKELGEKKLAKKLRTDSKERMIIILEKYVKKKTKKLSKKM